MTRNRFEKSRCVPKMASPEALKILYSKTYCERTYKYRCVPKIASPEARTNFSKKTYYSAIQRDGPTGSTKGGGAQQASQY